MLKKQCLLLFSPNNILLTFFKKLFLSSVFVNVKKEMYLSQMINLKINNCKIKLFEFI